MARCARSWRKSAFKGDLQAFFKFMREDPQFYLPQTEEGQQKYLAMATTDHRRHEKAAG